MISSVYNEGMYGANYGMSALYGAMSSDINSTVTNTLIKNADRLSGNEEVRDYISDTLDEAKHYRNEISSGVSMVQTASEQSSQIGSKLGRMEELAEMAASGDYSAEEVSNFQDEFNQLIGEVDEIAIKTNANGENMLSYDSTVEIEAGSGMAVDIETKDLTISGLGVIDNVDLENDAESALAGVQSAISEVEDYQGRLAEQEQTLSDADDILVEQQSDLNTISKTVESSDAAWAMVSTIMGGFSNDSAMMLAMQANETAESAMSLLLSEN